MLFKPTATVLGAHEMWDPCSQEGLSPSLRVTSTEPLIIRLQFHHTEGVQVRLPVTWNLEGGMAKDQLHHRAAGHQP